MSVSVDPVPAPAVSQDVAERAQSTAAGDTFSFNVFSIGRVDLKQLAAMQHEYFQKARALIASSPPETVAVMSLQLFEFDVSPRPKE